MEPAASIQVQETTNYQCSGQETVDGCGCGQHPRHVADDAASEDLEKAEKNFINWMKNKK